MIRSLILSIFFLIPSIVWGKIYDCFTFFNELEILKIRLEELYDEIDYFVLIEETKAFGGDDKPLFYFEHRQDFSKYNDKIIHLVVEQFPELTGIPRQDHWNREIHAHNSALKALETCHRNDLVITSDVDEIPSKDAIRRIKAYFEKKLSEQTRPKAFGDLICALDMRLFQHRLNRERLNRGWNGPVKVAPYWIVKKLSPWAVKILHQFSINLHRIKNGGWHFTKMQNPEDFLYLMKNHTHRFNIPDLIAKSEQDLSAIEEHIKERIATYTLVPIDDSYPEIIWENLEYFEALGWISDETESSFP